MATQKLLYYFTDHEVVVVTSYPLGDIVHNHDAAGWISKWALKLMGHDIRYIPHTAIKSQALMDCHRMDGGPAIDPGRHPRVLDDVLRRVRDGTRIGGWSGSGLPR